ncbi:MAG: prolyl aminopeptidase [Methylococcaceae bacterium]|nr:prolyl aminopeptidase [Methylococcaceae bacterium]
MTVLYPELEPYKTHHLVRDEHTLMVEECGNPDGLAALFLHGGPGSGCKPYHRRFFDPAIYRVILVDQRGSGRSTPQGELNRNTTALLLEDMEFIRIWLGIHQWLVFAGSWGATLALLLAQGHPDHVAGLILRGTFLARASDLAWFFGEGGVRRIYPEAWARLLDALTEEEAADPIQSLYRHVIGSDELAQRRAARALDGWSSQVTVPELFNPDSHDEHVSKESLNAARIGLHYAANRYFIPENAVLEGCERIRHIPTQIIHGRRDLVCPVESATCLHRQLPNSTLLILENAGHVAAGDHMISALVEATDSMAITLGFGK